MYLRFTMIAAAALSISANAIADPASPTVRDPNPSANRPASVVLASAEQAQAQAPTPDQTNAAPAKPKRVARVTTCRCGDQVEQPDQ